MYAKDFSCLTVVSMALFGGGVVFWGADSTSCGRCPEIQCDTQAQECDIVLLSALFWRDTMCNRISNIARYKSLTRGQISRHARKVISEAFFTQLVISKDGSLVSSYVLYQF